MRVRGRGRSEKMCNETQENPKPIADERSKAKYNKYDGHHEK